MDAERNKPKLSSPNLNVVNDPTCRLRLRLESAIGSTRHLIRHLASLLLHKILFPSQRYPIVHWADELAWPSSSSFNSLSECEGVGDMQAPPLAGVSVPVDVRAMDVLRDSSGTYAFSCPSHPLFRRMLTMFSSPRNSISVQSRVQFFVYMS